MKIRHKQSGVELEGEFYQLGVATESGVLKHYRPVGTGYGSQYDCREWEEVKPAPQWVDVTGECEVPVFTSGVFELWHLGNQILSRGMAGYRVRKVQLRQLDSDPVLGFQRTWAFIIEQRQS